MTSNNTRPGWSLAVALVTLILLLTMIFYHQTVIYLIGIWNQVSIGEYAHGYLVLAISIYLMIRSRNKLAECAPCPSYIAFLFLVPAAVLWLLAAIVDVEMLQTIGLLGVLFSLTWTLFGHQAMKILAFPILFIGFAIPVWFPLSPILQNVTADVVFWIMRMIEVPAFRNENMISIPSGLFSIEEACSGLRYLLAALTLGSLYAYLNYITLLGRVAVVLVAAITAVLANIIRVFIVVYLGYATEMEHPWVGDHLMLGWYIFGGLIAVLLFVDARFYRHGSVAEGVTGDVAVEESPRTGALCSKSRIQYFIIATLCVIVLSIGPIIVLQKDSQQQLSSVDIDLVLPEDIEGWSRPMVSVNDWMPQYHGATSAKSDYQVRGEEVTLFVAYYPYQKQGTEVINDLNRISNNKVWRTKSSHARVRHLRFHDVMEQVVENKQNEKRLIWYWYNIGGQVTINKYEAKALQLAGLLLGQPQAYMVAVSVLVKDDPEQSRDFLNKIVAELNVPLSNLQITSSETK